MKATRRTASAASPPACGAARPSWRAPAATGPATPSRSACSTPRPMRLPCSKPAARRSTSCRSKPARPAWYHPGRSGTIKLGPEDGARPFRRVPSEDAGGARRFRPALRLRGLCRRHAGAEGQADAHQAEARAVAVPGGQARLRLRRRQAVEAGALIARRGGRRQQADHRRLGVRRVRGRRRSATARSRSPSRCRSSRSRRTLTDEDFEALAGRIVENVEQADRRRAAGLACDLAEAAGTRNVRGECFRSRRSPASGCCRRWSIGERHASRRSNHAAALRVNVPVLGLGAWNMGEAPAASWRRRGRRR